MRIRELSVGDGQDLLSNNTDMRLPEVFKILGTKMTKSQKRTKPQVLVSRCSGHSETIIPKLIVIMKDCNRYNKVQWEHSSRDQGVLGIRKLS